MTGISQVPNEDCNPPGGGHCSLRTGIIYLAPESVAFPCIPYNWDDALQSGAEPSLGDDTTDESDGEVSHYSARRKEILDNAATVFADASEEFVALPTVKKRLEAWKATQAGELELFKQNLPESHLGPRNPIYADVVQIDQASRPVRHPSFHTTGVQ